MFRWEKIGKCVVGSHCSLIWGTILAGGSDRQKKKKNTHTHTHKKHGTGQVVSKSKLEPGTSCIQTIRIITSANSDVMLQKQFLYVTTYKMSFHIQHCGYNKYYYFGQTNFNKD
jgi:hypothetical protein